jgi:hypothetical protein
LHDLTSGDEKLREGWLVVLPWTSGNDANAAVPDTSFTSANSSAPMAWEDLSPGVPDIRISAARRSSRETSRPAVKPFVYSFGGLDKNVRTYLAEVAKRQGVDSPGVFLAGDETTGWIDFVPAIFLIALTIGSCWVARYLTPVGSQFFVILQFVLAAATCMLLLHTIRKHRAAKHGIGSFIYADRAYLWEVRPLTVKVLPLANVTSVQRMASAVEDQDHVILSFYDGRTYRMNALAAESADEVTGFLRQVAADNAAEPAREPSNDIPKLTSPSWVQWLRRIGPALAAGVVGMVFACGVMLPINRLMREEHLHGKALQGEGDDTEPLRAYLAEFPKGRYAGAVQAQLLAACKAQAEADRTPAPLRKFLVECDDPELKQQARKEVKRNYERKAADYRKGAEAKGNPDIVQGFGALLEKLGASELAPGKTAPTVAVTFHESHDLEPVDQVAKFMEKLARADMKNGVMKSPEILFANDQIKKRQTLLLSRLQRALEARVSGQFVALTSETRAQPTIEIAYHINPAGDFFTWRETVLGGAPQKKNPWDPVPLPNFNLFPRPAPVWLVRQYNIDWSITIIPPDNDRRFSTGAKIVNTRKKLNWTTQGFSDAKRDPYFYIMDLMVHDLSDQVIGAFGLPAQARPPEPKEN